jgi:hypothetical protein
MVLKAFAWFDSGRTTKRPQRRSIRRGCASTPKNSLDCSVFVWYGAGWSTYHQEKGDVRDKLTMSVNEVICDMRNHGIRMSPKKFNLMVDSGVLPFVKVVGRTLEGRRSQVILRQEYYRWRKTILEVNAHE